MKSILISVTDIPEVFEVHKLHPLKPISVVTGAKGLADLLAKKNIDPKRDEIYTSSNVEFCDEWGWKKGSAEKLLAEAFELLTTKF